MNTVLLVDDDKSWLACLEDYMNVYASHLQVLSAPDGARALEIIKSHDVDLIMTDLKMPQMDGYELLSRLSKHHPEMAVIIASALDESEVKERLNNNGSYRYLRKPIQLKVLGEEIIKTLKEDSRGFVHGFSLSNFLQLVEMEQKTCTLLVKAKGKVGYLYLEKGELIDAETNGNTGLEAAVRIIGWETAATQIQRIKKRKRTIKTSIMNLLLKASCRNDENGAAVAQENMLEEAILQAEGRHFKQSMGLLARLLKKNPRNHLSWLWYSRISENIGSIRTGLRNAAKLEPRDTEVVDEINKLKCADKFSENESIQRCPFCWCPNRSGSLQCDYCSAHLQIHTRVFEAEKNAKEEILNQAAERYLRVIAREKNTDAQYYLAMVHLNHENWEKALQYLDKTVKLAPDEPHYAEQLNMLLNQMASSSERTDPDNDATGNDSGGDVDIPDSPIQCSVLVVEDSPTTRKVISITLEQQGFGVIEAGDGLKALSKLNDTRPDLVLLDIILPKMDGYKILSIIKNNPELKDIPVIMLTSKDGILNKVKGKVSGCEAYLTKPFDPQELIETVEKYI